MIHCNYIMKRGRGAPPRKRTEGYTIVETLIFMAVSGAMFATAMLLVNGQQQRTEFTQAVRGFESTLQDLANDVSTGFSAYPFAPGQSCKVSPIGVVTIDNNPVGAQQRCIFIGRVIQAEPQGTNEQTFQVYTVVGRQRLSVGGKEVSTLEEATPLALAPAIGARASIPDLSETRKIGAGASIGKVYYQTGGAPLPIGAFGFFTTFQSYGAGGSLTGTTQVNIAPVSATSLNQARTSVANRIDSHTLASPTLTPLNPSGGITVCLLSNGSRQYALVSLGGSSTGRLAVTTSIENGSVCP
jgi:type II secretory pathway pseudopilin PulG